MKILVPTDFSNTATTGLRYAIHFCNNYGGGEIHVLNVYENTDDRATAEAKLNDFIKVDHPTTVSIHAHVSHGDPKQRIGDFALETGCTLVIMASHGARGFQKILGSNAVRTVANTDIPFIITQREVYDDEVLDRIAVPVTLEKEDKKILSTVAALAAPLKASVLLIYQDNEDEFLGAAIARNLNFAKSYLRNRGVNTQSIDIGHDGPFDEALVRYAALNQCDLIATVNHHNDGILNLFGSNFDQNVLENAAHIPVLTVNTKNNEHVNDIFMTTR